VSVNFYLSMWTISCSQLFGDVCSSKSLIVEIEKKKITHITQAHQHTRTQPHTPCTCTHMHTRHAHAHTAHTPHAMHRHSTHTHNSLSTSHAQHTTYREKSEGKRGQSIQTIIFRTWSCCLSQTHLLSSKGRVQLHGGAANWWSCYSRVGLVEPEPSQTRPKCTHLGGAHPMVWLWD
jgi:hypothetical protein